MISVGLSKVYTCGCVSREVVLASDHMLSSRCNNVHYRVEPGFCLKLFGALNVCGRNDRVGAGEEPCDFSEGWLPEDTPRFEGDGLGRDSRAEAWAMRPL